jgi:hypothetical protein
MILLSRAKHIIVTPKSEWAFIADEEESANSVFMNVALPVILACAFIIFIVYTFFWSGEHFVTTLNESAALRAGLYFGIQTALIGIAGVWLTAAIVNALAPVFGSEKNMGHAMQLVTYAMTPAWVVGLLVIFLPFRIIGLIFGGYGLYLMYLGLPRMMKTPQEKVVKYLFSSVIFMFVIYFALGFIYELFLWDVIASALKNIHVNQIGNNS